MPKRDLSYLNTPITIVVRGFCGAVLGLFVGLGWRRWGMGTDGAINWIILGVAVVMSALLAIRYGDEFWASAKWW